MKKKIIFRILQILTAVLLGAAISAYMRQGDSALFTVLVIACILAAVIAFLQRPRKPSARSFLQRLTGKTGLPSRKPEGREDK